MLSAEAINPESVKLLLEQTELLAAVGEFSHALATLDRYDLRATGEERAAGSALRKELLAQRTARLREAEAQAAKAWNKAVIIGSGRWPLRDCVPATMTLPCFPMLGAPR